MALIDIETVFTKSVSFLSTFNTPATWNGEVPSTAMPTRTLQVDSIPLTSLRVHDAPQTNLPGTSATDDLGLYGATFGTNSLYIGTGDVKTLTVTRYARFFYALPNDYKAGNPVTCRYYAGHKTAVADGSSTLDMACYESDGEQGVSADLCATAAVSDNINSTSFANVDFTITATSLAPGDILDIRFSIAVVDTAGASAVDPTVGKIQMLTSRQ